MRISFCDVAFNERADLSVCPNITLMISYFVVGEVQNLILKMYPQFDHFTYSRSLKANIRYLPLETTRI